MQICDKKDCTLCLGCKNSCPKDAITVTHDACGMTEVQIDKAKCIECHLCQRVCPANTKRPLAQAEYAVAAWSESETDSSSGGVAAVLAKKTLQLGGTVYGAAVTENITRHIRVTDQEALEALRGSKYVQSDIGWCYRQVKDDLQSGRTVLFIGTPCQVAGLYGYLRTDSEKLITVDLICHGTPPHTYLTEHLNTVCDRHDSYSFRGKHDFMMSAYHGNATVYQKPSGHDLYFEAFLQGLTYRESCYSCPYARPERVADITVGDFWGIDRSTLQHPYKGRISLVLQNTKKGQDFFETAKDSLVWEIRPFSEAANREQGNLLHPSVPHLDRARFLQAYPKLGFDRAVAKTAVGRDVRRNRRSHRISVRAYRKLRRILSKLKMR